MIKVKQPIELGRRGKGKLALRNGQTPVQIGRIPRVARLMALAIRFDGLLRSGAVTNQSELARLAEVSQPRMTQILNLLHLAPAIQESLLFLPPVVAGKATIHEKRLRPIAAAIDWTVQRELWAKLER